MKMATSASRATDESATARANYFRHLKAQLARPILEALQFVAWSPASPALPGVGVGVAAPALRVTVGGARAANALQVEPFRPYPADAALEWELLVDPHDRDALGARMLTAV